MQETGTRPINLPPNTPVKKWTRGEPTKPFFEKQTTQAVLKAQKEVIGITCDARIVDWNPKSLSGFGVLLLRDGKPRISVYVRRSRIVTLGEIKVGSKIRCRVESPIPPHKTLEALDVEIYIPEIPVPESDTTSQENRNGKL
jgi:hypothetical protein